MEEEVVIRLHKGAKKRKRPCSSSYLTRNILPCIILGHDILIAPQFYLPKTREICTACINFSSLIVICVNTWRDAARDFSRAILPRGMK